MGLRQTQVSDFIRRLAKGGVRRKRQRTIPQTGFVQPTLPEDIESSRQIARSNTQIGGRHSSEPADHLDGSIIDGRQFKSGRPVLPLKQLVGQRSPHGIDAARVLNLSRGTNGEGHVSDLRSIEDRTAIRNGRTLPDRGLAPGHAVEGGAGPDPGFLVEADGHLQARVRARHGDPGCRVEPVDGHAGERGVARQGKRLGRHLHRLDADGGKPPTAAKLKLTQR